ncbi:hypothetical protein [Nonomuraea sp. NPDC023979]|uniref:hypothetical protein n=1 Tax=Nonomuraea sp. NPDC023979 TaxID=3154796 RepID=UPI0033D3ADDD
MRVTVILAVALALASGCGGQPPAPPPSATPAPIDTGPRTVVYRIGGTAHVGDITVQTASGVEQTADALLPAEVSYEMPPGSFASVFVQNAAAEGSVSCEIVVDGTTVSRNSSEGEYVIASCDGTVP